jgi:hypothetical protein
MKVIIILHSLHQILRLIIMTKVVIAIAVGTRSVVYHQEC